MSLGDEDLWPSSLSFFPVIGSFCLSCDSFTVNLPEGEEIPNFLVTGDFEPNGEAGNLTGCLGGDPNGDAGFLIESLLFADGTPNAVFLSEAVPLGVDPNDGADFLSRSLSPSFPKIGSFFSLSALSECRLDSFAVDLPEGEEIPNFLVSPGPAWTGDFEPNGEAGNLTGCLGGDPNGDAGFLIESLLFADGTPNAVFLSEAVSFGISPNDGADFLSGPLLFGKAPNDGFDFSPDSLFC